MNSRTMMVTALAVIATGCSSVLYVPTVDNVSSNSSLDELTTGRLLYTQRCSSCHNLHSPQQFEEEKWRALLPDMGRRAKLTVQEEGFIEKYLIAGINRDRTKK